MSHRIIKITITNLSWVGVSNVTVSYVEGVGKLYSFSRGKNVGVPQHNMRFE